MAQYFFGRRNTTTSGTTYFIIGDVGSNNEDSAKLYMPISGTFSDLRVELSTAPGSGDSRTFTFRKNGAGTSLTTTISNTDTANSDASNTVTVAAGDYITLQQTTAGTPATTDVFYALKFEADTATNLSYMGTAAGLSTIADRYTNAFGSGTGLSTNNYFGTVSEESTIAEFHVDLDTAPGSGKSWDVSIQKNGTTEATSTVTISDSDTTGSVTGLSISVSPGDELNILYSPTGTPSSTNRIRFSTVMSDTQGDALMYGCMALTDVFDSEYMSFFQSVNIPSSTESGLLMYNGLDSYDVSKLSVKLDTAPGVGNSRTFTFRKNGSNTSLAVTISGTDTSGVDTTNTVSMASGDSISLLHTESGTPTDSGRIGYCVMSVGNEVAPTGGLPKGFMRMNSGFWGA